MKMQSLVFKITILSLIFLIIVITSNGITHFGLNDLTGKIGQIVDVELPAVQRMAKLDMHHDGMKGIVFKSIVGVESNSKEVIESAQKEYEEMSGEMRQNFQSFSSIDITKSSKEAISAAIPEIEKYLAVAGEIVNNKGNKADSYKRLPEFEKSFSLLEEKLAQLGELIEKDAETNGQAGKALASSISFQNLIITGGCFVLALLAAVFILMSTSKTLRSVMSILRQTSEEITSVSKQVAESSRELSDSTTKQAASLEETVAALGEVSSMVQKNSQNSSLSAELAVTARNAAVEGDEEIKKLILLFSELSLDSKKIEEITTVIDDIAFQTNLLALNAAVEAARAGEQGKGFAVVAEAVRALAQRSANAAKDIALLIRSSVERISVSSQQAEKSEQKLEEIVNLIKKLSDLNSEISIASQEQASGVNEIEKAMIQLDSISQMNSSQSEEASASGDILILHAEKLRDSLISLGQLAGTAS